MSESGTTKKRWSGRKVYILLEPHQSSTTAITQILSIHRTFDGAVKASGVEAGRWKKSEFGNYSAEGVTIQIWWDWLES